MSQVQLQPSRVLIIEDSATFAAILKCGIEDTHGLQVDIAKTLTEAREQIEANPHAYFVAIVDLHLPDAPNGEAAHFIVSTGIPALVFTGSLSSEPEQLWKIGIADYVHKDTRNSLPYVIWAVGRYVANRHIGVLVVDDIKAMCQHLAHTLALQNFCVFSTPNAEDAIKIARQQPMIKIAIIDRHIANRDGLELTQELITLKQGELFEVIGMSESGASTPFLKAGATDFLPKPFTNEELLCRINRSAERLDNYAHLQNLNEIKNRFLSMAAHDLRNPIGAIKAAAKSMSKPAAPVERRERALQMIHDNCEGMLGLLEGLLDIGVIESGKLSLNKKVTDINHLVDQRIDVLREQAMLKDISLTTRFDEPTEVDVDPIKFGQVIDNLLSNAIKYSPEHTQVHIRVETSGSIVRIQVIDSGKGIEDEETEQLFQPFRTLSTKSTSGERQTGLGLAIVKSIVDAHGGEIFFKRTSEGRSRFVVTIATV